MFVCVCASQSIRKHALSLFFSFCTPRSHAAAGRHYSVLLNKQTMERALNKQRKPTLTRTHANRQRRACVCVVLTLSHCATVLSEREEKRAATAGSVFVCTKATRQRLLLSHSNSQPLALPALRWGEMETALRQRLRLRRRLRRRRRLWLWRYFSCGVHAIRNQSMSWS